jgi:hypothetical protein
VLVVSVIEDIKQVSKMWIFVLCLAMIAPKEAAAWILTANITYTLVPIALVAPPLGRSKLSLLQARRLKKRRPIPVPDALCPSGKHCYTDSRVDNRTTGD